jgi:outer membrane biosynthesis protein TonB
MPRTRKARSRERQDSPQITPPTEIRGGLSESTRSPSEVAQAGPAVAEGNSSEVGVDPSKAGQPLPPVAAVGLGGEVDFEAIAVEDAFADTAADCSGALPQLDLTDDAINAGLRRGRLVFEVIIDQTGRVRSPRMVKGTGYDIDRVAREAISKIVCKPAQADGTAAVVRKELVFEVVDY